MLFRLVTGVAEDEGQTKLITWPEDFSEKRDTIEESSLCAFFTDLNFLGDGLRSA